jgi:tape measure domain-containing protein
VVSLQFDNKQFERNTATTMSTLDKLKEKLTFNKASKGLEDVGIAAKNVRMDGLGSGVEAVTAKFSALQVMGITALSNLTNSAVNAGKRIASALTIDPVKTGLSEYETKINAIQVMKTNTRGKNTMEDINKALEDLNEYADKTIYNYTQMTQNAGKFTAQGFDVFQATDAIKGLANLAAASGASAEDMSRATYQMSQALGGVIRTIDWNSLRNANMATEQLKGVIKDIAALDEIDVDKMIKDKGTFENTLAEGWLTGDMFMEAMNIYSGVYSEAELKAKGFTESQVKNFIEIAKEAEAAATQVKTFSQLWDVLKETAQSGWTKTWELIIGDFETASKTLTALQVYLSGIIDKISDFRNAIVEGALYFARPWQTIMEKLDAAGFTNISNAISDMTGKLEYFQDVVDRVWHGDFNNWGDNPDRRDLLKEAGYDHRVVQYLVNLGEESHKAGKKYKLTTEDVVKAHKKYGIAMEVSTESTQSLNDALLELSDEQLEQAGLTRLEIGIFRDLAKESKKSGKSIQELAEEMSKVDGRTLLVDSFKNIGKTLESVFGSLKKAWQEVFPPVSIVGIYNAIKSFNEFTGRIRDFTEKHSEKLKNALKGVLSIFKIIGILVGGPIAIAFKVGFKVLTELGLGIGSVVLTVADAIVRFSDWLYSLFSIEAVVKFLVPLIVDAGKAIGEWLTELKESETVQEAFSKMAEVVKKVLAGIGPAVKTAAKFLGFLFTLLKKSKVVQGLIWAVGQALEWLQSGFEKILTPIQNAIDKFTNWIETLKDSENLPRDIAKGIASGFKKALDWVKNFFKSIPDYVGTGLEQLSNTPVSDIASKLKSGLGVVADVVKEFGKIVINKIKEYLNVSSFEEISADTIAGLAQGLRDKASSVWDAAVSMVADLVQKVKDFLGIHSPSTVFIAIGGFIVAGLIGGITSALQNGEGGALAGFTDFFTPIIEWIKGIDLGQVFAAVTGTGIALMIKKILDITDKFASPMESLGDLFGKATEILDDNAKNFGKVIKGFASNLKAEAFKTRMEGFQIFVKSLVLLIAAIIVLSFFDPKKLLVAVGVVMAVGVVLVALMLLMNLVNKASVSFTKEDGFQAQGFTTGLIGLGAAILLMAITLKMLGKLNKNEALRGFTILGGIVLGLIALSATLGILSKFDMTGFGGPIFKLAAAIAILVVVVKLLGGMKPEKLQRGIEAIVLLSGLIVGLMAATRLIGSGANVDKIGTALLGVAGAIALMGLTVRLIGGMKASKLQRGVDAITTFSVIIVGLMYATRLIGSGSNVDKIGKALLGVAVAIGVMGLTVRLIGGMDPSKLDRGIQAVAALTVMIAGLMAATKLIGTGSNVGKIGGALLGVATAISAMGLVVALLGAVPEDGLKRGLGAVSALSLVMVGLMAATRLLGGRKKVENAGSCLLAVAGAIGILASVAIALGFVPVKNLAKGVVFVGILSAMMAGLMAVTKLTKFSKNGMSNLLVIAGIIALLGGLLIAMSYLKTDKISTASTAMAKVIGMLALFAFATKFITKVDFKQFIGPVATLVGVVALLAAVVTIMANKLTNVDAVIPAAIALGIMLAGMSGAIAILAAVGKLINSNATGILKGIGLLTLILIPLAGAAFILASMSGLENATGIIKALLMFVGGITLLLLPLALIGVIAIPALYGIAVMAVLVTALAAMTIGLGALMSTIPGMQQFVDTGIAVLIQLATGVGDMIAAFTTKVSEAGLLKVLGVFAMMPLLVFGLATLLPLMLTVGAVATAIGGLVSYFPQLETFLNVGIPILIKLAAGVGEMVGAFVGGIITQVASTLPYLGTMLSDFMGNAQVFIMGAKMVDEKVLAGVGILAGAILALTAADLIAGIVSFVQGGSSLADLGAQLSMFMMNAMPFIMGSSMISEDMLSGVKMLADTILVLTAANVIEGLTSWLTGGSSLAGFAEQLPLLGQGLAAFSTSLGVFTEDQMTTVKFAAEAVKTLSAAAAEIPNSGGLLASLVGENDLGVFAGQFPFLGRGLRGFLDNVGTFSEEQVTTINCAADAVKSLAEAASEIPNMGGLLASIVGDNSIGTFSSQFPILGTGLRGFLDNVGTFSEEQVATVDCAARAVKSLAEASSKIPNMGGLLAAIVGDNGLSTFALQFPLLGIGIKSFLSNIGTFDDAQNSTVECAAKAIKELASASSAIPNTGGLLAQIVGDNDLSTFASKFPSVGKGIKGFVDELGTFSAAQVETVRSGVSAVRALTGLANVDLNAAKKNISGFGKKLPDFAENLKEFCTGMPSSDSVTTAVNNIDKLLDSTKKIGDANSGVLKDFASNLKKVGEDAVKKFVGAFTSDSAKKDLKSAAETLAGKAPDGAKEKKSAMMLAGNDLGNGLINGLNAKQTAVYNAGYALGQKAVQGEKDGQQSKSPSKLTIKAGKWLGEGLVIGIDKMGRAVYNSGYALGESAVKSTSSAISRIADAINTDIDAQPTIRPVMDLSDVRAGANTIGNLLNTESSIGVVANAGRIGGMMNRYSQNRGNDDVVSELSKLRSEIGNMGNTSYNINGITYDDGSNVRTAVETLVRAARIERRT